MIQALRTSRHTRRKQSKAIKKYVSCRKLFRVKVVNTILNPVYVKKKRDCCYYKSQALVFSSRTF